ncbi:MAG: ATPase [Gammaproteobacteria bacterium]|nr:ATPase [Gammaproteobacteria bacterium]
MQMDRDQFLSWSNKAVSLLGMSGVGKTTLANRLPKSDWFHYSADYRIGTKYLEEPILDNIKRQAMQVGFLRDLLRSDSIYICSNITVHNLEPLSTFLGKVGAVQNGGLSVEEFRRRQRLHRNAEIGATRDAVEFIDKGQTLYGYSHFIADTSGSICELDDPQTIELLARHSLLIYIAADDEMQAELIRRAVAAPKPLYYQEQFFDQHLLRYLDNNNLACAAQMDPDHFVQWIFPFLVEHRRPRYQWIANRYGYTVSAADVASVRDETDFLELVATALSRSRNAA